MARAGRRGTDNRGSTNGKALMGSGRKIDTSSESEAAAKRKRAQQWQGQAFGFYDSLGEIWFAHNFIGNALRRARLAIAIPDPEGGAPAIVEETDDEAAGAAYDALDRIQAASGGQGAILATMGMTLSIVGEGYLVGWTPPDSDGEEWDVFSPDQIITDGDDWRIRSFPGQAADAAQLLKSTDFVGRIWRRHPQWRDLADSSMRPLIPICDELQILSQAIRAAAVSRIAGAGLLTMPTEISFGSVDPTEDSGDGGELADPFSEDLMAAMLQPIADPQAASATVPLLVRGPKEMIGPDAIRHITFDRPLDPEQAKQRVELIKRIANGLDLPADLLLGIGTANHWTGWLIDDQVFTAHIEPLLTLICWGLTSAYLRSALKGTAAEGMNYMVWYDASAMVKHPNQSQDADSAMDNAAIGFAAYRKLKSIPESDAMDDADFKRWQEIQAAKHGSKPGAPGVPASQETVVKGTPDTPAALPEDDQEPVQASANRRDRLPVGSELLDLERALRNRLQVAADASLQRVLEMAGAKLRRKVGQRGTLAASIRDVDNAMVAKTLGRNVVESLGFANQALTDAAFVDLAPKWNGWTTQAQRRVVAIANRESQDDPIDPDDYIQAHEDDRHAGWLLLVGGLTNLAAQRLYDPDPQAPLLGEYDSVSTIPLGLIRGALSRAGGTNGRILDTGAMVTLDADGKEVAAGGLATGMDALGLLEDAGLSSVGWLWSTGGPERPFEPHEALDGVDFTDFADEQLAADPGEFPYVSVYAPGDHSGCQCDVAPLLEANVVDVPDVSEEAA